MQPTAIQERVELLDILRGVAIFGMFTVNMTADIRWSDQFTDANLSLADSISLVLVDLLTHGKFITIFSFLFGIGFYVQSERAMQRGENVPAFWIKRLAGLLFIGLTAQACTLPAWILIDYSIFGLGLLLVYRLPPRWILVVALACFVIPKTLGTLQLLSLVEPGGSSGITVEDMVHESEEMVFRTGSVVDIGSTNLVHIWEAFTNWYYYLGDLELLGLMVLGLFIGRIGAVWNRDIQLAVARKAAPWLLGIGFLSCSAWVVMKQAGVGDESSLWLQFIAGFLAWPLGMMVLGLGYAAAITVLVDHPKWHGLLVRFVPIGRMALTNYLFTGLVAAMLAFQWGFGLYGEIFPATGLLIVIVLLPLQMLASQWWLQRFRFGPIEWLWRAWTYGRLPRMSR